MLPIWMNGKSWKEYVGISKTWSSDHPATAWLSTLCQIAAQMDMASWRILQFIYNSHYGELGNG